MPTSSHGHLRLSQGAMVYSNQYNWEGSCPPYFLGDNYYILKVSFCLAIIVQRKKIMQPLNLFHTKMLQFCRNLWTLYIGIYFPTLQGEHHKINIHVQSRYVLYCPSTFQTIPIPLPRCLKNKSMWRPMGYCYVYALIYKSNKHVQDNAGEVLSTFST